MTHSDKIREFYNFSINKDENSYIKITKIKEASTNAKNYINNNVHTVDGDELSKELYSSLICLEQALYSNKLYYSFNSLDEIVEAIKNFDDINNNRRI